MRVLTIEEIKSRELEILRKLVEICRREGLYYTLAYGTLIGAIRHKGFIPWDDDIDVYMPRPDYNRLLAIWDEQPDVCGYKLINPRNGSGVPFAKIVDTHCRVAFSNVVERCHSNDYLWIDIFPVDGDRPHGVIAFLLTVVIRAINFLRNQVLLKNKSIPGGVLRKASGVFYKSLLFWVPIRWFAQIPDTIVSLSDYGTATTVGSFSRAGYLHRINFDKDGFQHPVVAPFEGMALNLPSNYHLILTKFYGDYMRLPPEDQRESHELRVLFEE